MTPSDTPSGELSDWRSVSGEFGSRTLAQLRRGAPVERDYIDWLDVPDAPGFPDRGQPGINGSGLYGAGTALVDGQLRKMVLIDRRIYGGEAAPATSVQGNAGVARALRQANATDDVWLVPTSEPELQFSPGDAIWNSRLPGTLGAIVECSDSLCALTAGHVGHTLGNVIQDSEGVLGTIVFSEHGKTVAPMEPTVDVAVIEVAAGRVSELASGVTIHAPRDGKPGESVTSHGRHGVRSGTLRTFSSWLYVPGANAVLVDVYQTFTGISKRGDSGAPVVAEDDALIGMIVAGNSDESFIQAADTQLAATGCELRSDQ